MAFIISPAEQLIAFSCKNGGICPSFGTSRMVESAALLVEEVLPHLLMRQSVLSVPYPLRFLLAREPQVMGRVLQIVYRSIAAQLIKQAGLGRPTTTAGTITLIQRFKEKATSPGRRIGSIQLSVCFASFE